MADETSSQEEAIEATEIDRAIRRKYVDTQYFSTARTAPRAAGESRIGTDEAHARLQEARNHAKRDATNIRLDDVSADH